jgi:very-short-patch-repair endonuclease
MSRNTTLHQRKLFNALLARGVPAEMEEGDGHKHVDIGIPSARIYIEVDGLHHLTSAEQILCDITRDHYSDDEGKATIHVPNEFLDFAAGYTRCAMSTLFLDIETIPAEDEKRETLAYLYERKREKARSRVGEGDAAGRYN